MALVAADGDGDYEDFGDQGQGFLNHAEVSLTCLRTGNECLEAGKGDKKFEVLPKLIEAALETQEYVMEKDIEAYDGKDEDHWVFHDGKWALKKKEEAEKKHAEAEKKYVETEANLLEEWRKTAPTASPTDKEDGAERRQLVLDVEDDQELSSLAVMMTPTSGSSTDEPSLWAANMDETYAANAERRLWSSCSYSICMEGNIWGTYYICSFYCRRLRRQLRASRALHKSSADVCVTHTHLKAFLHQFPTDPVKECVNEQTLCQLSHPCSV